MSLSYREKLVAARPGATAYAKSVAELPETLVGLRGRIAKQGTGLIVIKGLGALHPGRAIVTKHGLATADGRFHDHSAVIARTEKGRMDHSGQEYSHRRLSHRQVGALARVVPLQTSSDTLHYYVDGPNGTHLGSVNSHELWAGDASFASEQIRMTDQSDSEVLPGVPLENDLTQGLREFLYREAHIPKEEVGLFVRPPGFSRPLVPRLSRDQEGETLYSDGGQLLVTSEATLAWMNEQLAEKHRDAVPPIPKDNFRPNLVLAELPPNAEDFITAIRCTRTGVELLFSDPCGRCPVIRVDTRTGEYLPRKNLPIFYLRSDLLKYLCRSRIKADHTRLV